MVNVDSISIFSLNGVDESFYAEKLVKVPPGGALDEPSEKTGDGIITVCLNRDYGDCDYAAIGELKAKIPVKGSVTFAFPIQQLNNNNNTYVKLVEENGGPHEMELTNFYDWLQINPNDTRQVSWDIPRDLGVFEGILFQRYEDVDFFLSIDAQIARPGKGTTNASIMMSSVTDKTTPNMPTVSKIQLVWSCLAKGTQIRLADGTGAKIEELTTDHSVMTNGSGLAFDVVDMSVGIENTPMVRIEDDQGHSLLLTKTHPVVTVDHGVLWAEELAVGTKVKTESGVATLVKVEREMYEGSVHNIKLDPGRYADELPYKGSTMYANGFLVGDLAMQRAYTFKDKEDRDANVLERIPAQWHTDYKNSAK
jgi:hypothetical protein